MQVNSKYLTPIFTVLILVFASLQTALVGGLELVESLSLAALAVGGFVTYIAKFLPGGWPAVSKVAGAVVGAVLVAVIAVLDGSVFGGAGFNAETINWIFYAGLQALAAQFGVDARVDTAEGLLADPKVSNASVYVMDSSAYNVAVAKHPELEGGVAH